MADKTSLITKLINFLVDKLYPRPEIRRLYERDHKKED